MLRRLIDDVLVDMQLLQATNVSAARTNAGQAHDFFAQDGKRVLKTVLIPYLEQCHIQADMMRV
ncbi:hypothetical protein [Chitinophaga niastensis]|uniref:hypothetical protein n=1 Tax=Chitinophaga niastensis TaxID=536980 RepID=UPI001304EA30|nr:hypothetical protein [Chitinophaga niastensis]